MHVLFDGHPTADILGPEGREQFATVILGRVATGTWRRPARWLAPPPRTARTRAVSTLYRAAPPTPRKC
ncbi:hypothetical protein OHA79_44025 [Streptomyces sp. NBC_00841]|uniref:hypothetical protein n=1 Tax=unclassified Streptomyces TaxID=2593676 RepID=UPI00225B4531|nr:MULTISPECIES: hypothetical protein [unclassified Streptomyces]MCX4530074.1 hypothetical protein [Streptomyces sp. NBC_01669]WSA04135.1 hypothetical protein OHA79_44025 [Streptomyces sp. NBC_00841]